MDPQLALVLRQIHGRLINRIAIGYICFEFIRSENGLIISVKLFSSKLTRIASSLAPFAEVFRSCSRVAKYHGRTISISSQTDSEETNKSHNYF